MSRKADMLTPIFLTKLKNTTVHCLNSSLSLYLIKKTSFVFPQSPLVWLK